MLHSKIYFMELPDSKACAFIGSHNATTFALNGLNGEAAIMLEGPSNSPEFEKVREHINTSRDQAVLYSPDLKEAFAWWMREYLDGMKAEIGIPSDWTAVRTILLFANAASGERPKTGDHLYFEIPEGIEQIESLKTEAIYSFLKRFRAIRARPWRPHSLRRPSTPAQRLERRTDKEMLRSERIGELM